jgi:hypothetical protein
MVETKKSIFRRIALIFLHFHQRKLQRSKSTQTLSKAKTAIILYDALDKDDHREIREFAAWLATWKIRVSFVGYANTAQRVDGRFGAYDTILNRRSCNMLQIPKSRHIHSALNTEYDMLFELYVKPCFPLYSISVVSNARFKAGLFDENHAHLDFMINLGDHPSVGELSAALRHYLSELR